MLGKENKQPPIKRDNSKTVELPKGVKKEGRTGGKPPGTYDEETETLKAGGMEIKTKWYKYKADVGGTKTEAKMWMFDDVAGRMVKREMTTSGAVASKTTMGLTAIKKP